MTHGWTHPICRHCYADKEPGRNPVPGIYYRFDPTVCEAGS